MEKREFTPASFYQFLLEKKLMASRCQKCGTIYLPPRPLCPQCQESHLEWTPLKGKGKIAAFTAIAVGPTFMVQQGFDRNNLYYTGVVELEEGPRISARLLGLDPKQPEKVKVGTPVTVEFLERQEEGVTKPVLAFKV